MNTIFGRVAPTIYVVDLDKAIAFWTGAMGFTVTFTNGNPVVFAIVQRDAAELHLSVDPVRAGQCHCHLMLTGLEALAESLASRGVTIKQPLKRQPWDLQDIVIVDPDGNTMELAEPIAD